MITVMRTTILKPMVAIWLSVAVLLLGCDGCNKQEQRFSKSYSGEELFRGLLFADGEIADMIPELRQLKEVFGIDRFNDKQRAGVRNLEANLIAEIKKADASYFVDFQAEIQSGDPHRITAKLKDAGRLISYIIYENNKGLAPLLDNTMNQKFKSRLAAVSYLKDLRDRMPATSKEIDGLLKSLNNDLVIDRDIYINNVKNAILPPPPTLWINRNIDVNRFADLNKSQSFALNSQIDVFRFLDLDRNLNNHFDKAVNINRFAATEYNPVGDVTVEIETAVYAVVAVAVAVAAVIVVVVGRSDFLNDKAGLFNEQLVNSVAQNLKARVDPRSNAPYR